MADRANCALMILRRAMVFPCASFFGCESSLFFRSRRRPASRFPAPHIGHNRRRLVPSKAFVLPQMAEASDERRADCRQKSNNRCDSLSNLRKTLVPPVGAGHLTAMAAGALFGAGADDSVTAERTEACQGTQLVDYWSFLQARIGSIPPTSLTRLLAPRSISSTLRGQL